MFSRHRYYRVNPHYFHVRNPGLWRAGHWYHGAYDGAYGWWWMVGPTWYFYERPMYPYPTETMAPVYYAQMPGETPPAQVTVVVPPAQPEQLVAPSAQVQMTAVVPPAPVMMPPPTSATAPAAPAQYYYCANPVGYYPYVRDCAVGWCYPANYRSMSFQHCSIRIAEIVAA